MVYYLVAFLNCFDNQQEIPWYRSTRCDSVISDGERSVPYYSLEECHEEKDKILRNNKPIIGRHHEVWCKGTEEKK